MWHIQDDTNLTKRFANVLISWFVSALDVRVRGVEGLLGSDSVDQMSREGRNQST
jgi:hypothetical protein